MVVSPDDEFLALYGWSATAEVYIYDVQSCQLHTRLEYTGSREGPLSSAPLIFRSDSRQVILGSEFGRH